MTSFKATDPTSGFLLGSFLGLDVLAAENEQAYNLVTKYTEIQ
jgi:hypothetical protein